MTAQVVWGTGDENGGGHFGGIFGDIEDTGTVVGLWEQDAQAVTCDSGTPADTSDDFPGYIGTFRNGYGGGTVTIARDLGTATGSGVITITTWYTNDCTGVWNELLVETDVAFTLDLQATSRATHDVSRSHDLLAGHYNAHANMHMTTRYASGSATLGGAPYAFDSGLISRNTWSEHYLEH